MYRHVYNKEVNQPHFGMTSSAVKIPSNAGTRPVLYKKNQVLTSTNEGLSRRVKNLEEEVTFLFVVAGVSLITAILF